MNPMNLACVYNSFKQFRSTKISPPAIGVRDLKIVDILNNFWDNSGTKTYTCKLSYKDGTKILCNLTGKQVNGIIYAPAFNAQLNGLPATERCFIQVHYPIKTYNNPDEWIARLHTKKTKPKSEVKNNGVLDF